MARREKIFLFWREDLPPSEPGWLAERHRAGETLIPASIGGLRCARQAGLPFTLLEDWLGVDATLQARRAADDWEARWFEPARDALSSDGICWPVFDREALNWYWRDVSLADALVRACRERDVASVRLVRNAPPRPALWYHRSDVHTEIVRSALGDRVAAHETGHDPWAAVLTPAIALDRLCRGTATVPAGRIAGRILLVLNPGEFHRFTPVIAELGRRFPDRVTVLALWPAAGGPTALVPSRPVEVLSPAPAPTGAGDTKAGLRFFSGYLRAVSAAQGEPWGEALARTAFQFEFYCGMRLPVLAANFRAWSDLFGSHAPAAVITSSLPDAEAQLPALAADRAGIPTLSLPHGGFGAREQDCHARTVLYNCLPTRRVCEAAGIARERLRPCREVIAENEYATVAPGRLPERTGWRILTLTNPVKMEACLFNTTLTGSQVTALAALAEPPAQIADRVDLRVKTHPHRHDAALLEMAGGGLIQRMIPPEVPLRDALEGSDLVVALNYSGSALIYTLRARKPVIFFWNDPLLLRRSHSYRHSHLMLAAGQRVTTGDELWRAVERFFADPDHATALIERADRFARENLDSDRFPSIGEVVHALITNDAAPPKGDAPLETTTIETRPFPDAFPEAAAMPVSLAGYRFEDCRMHPAELRALCALVRWRNPRIVFEIGTYRGGTTLMLAANSTATIYTLDLPPEGHVDYVAPQVNDPTLDVFPETPGACFRNTVYEDRIRQLYGNSRSFDFSPYHGKTDLVFVDGAHDYETVLNDSMHAFNLLVAGGTIVWHDYSDYAPGVIRALSTVANRFRLIHLEGTSLAVCTPPAG